LNDNLGGQPIKEAEETVLDDWDHLKKHGGGASLRWKKEKLKIQEIGAAGNVIRQTSV